MSRSILFGKIVAGCLLVTFSLLVGLTGCAPNRIPEEKLLRFEHILERFRRDLKIPGMAAVVIKDQKIIWSKGFGYADRDERIEATPETPFHLASLTKPLAAVLALQLSERNVLDLDQRFSKYGVAPVAPDARLRHFLTHTSDPPSGSIFRYSGNRYGYIGIAMKGATGNSFRTLVEQNIMQTLNMENTAPNFVDPELLERFFSYLKAKGARTAITDERGNEYERCSLYDYGDPRYPATYALASNLIAGALEDARIERDCFRIPRSLTIDGATRSTFGEFWLADNRYVRVYRNLARPYELDSLGNPVLGQYSMFFNPAAGLISTVADLAKFDIALDENRLITAASKAYAFSPARSPAGERFPYGIGWFVQEFDGVTLVWHGGEWDCTSALYLKVPEEEITFIILTNASSLSSGFSMGEGDVLNSGVGLAFLRLFVFEERYGEIGPDIDWKALPGEISGAILAIESERMRDLYRRQLRNMETMFLRIGPLEVFHELVDGVHPVIIPRSERPEDRISLLAAITDVENNEHRIADFSIDSKANVHVRCVGEAWDGKVFDYGWIENRATGDTLWRMDAAKSEHAGGSVKNRGTETVIFLPEGTYRVHYRSDDSHSFGNWNAAPPDDLFWGIVVYGEGG